MPTNEDNCQYIQSLLKMSPEQIVYMKYILKITNNNTDETLKTLHPYMYGLFKSAPIHESYRKQKSFPTKQYKKVLYLLENHLHNPSDISSLVIEKRRNEEEKICYQCKHSFRRNKYSNRQWKRKLQHLCVHCVKMNVMVM